MANLLVEIGNTALKAAWSEGTTLGKTYRYQGEKRLEFILSLTAKEKPEVLTVSTVESVTREEQAALSAECGRLLVLDRNHKGALLAYGLPEHLSYDRVSSIVAVKRMFEDKACTVVDFGTTLTMDFVAEDGGYEGGVISPGCRTRFKSLNRYSRSLPMVYTTDTDLPEGDSIESSMVRGVVSGIMFEIDGHMRQHPENIFVFTGGDAAYFARLMKNSVFVITNLVMMGMAMITDDYVRKNLK